jgi:hypothetical protein
MMSSVAQTQSRKSSRRRIPMPMVIAAVVILGPLLWMTYTFIKLEVGSGIEQVGEYKMVNLKAMGNFPFDPTDGTVADVPEVYRKLDGQKVLLIGEMYVDFGAAATTDRFQLVWSIAQCCFGGPPLVQERVFAHAPEGQRVRVYDGLAKVYGTLNVRDIRENGQVVSLYDLDVERVEPHRRGFFN